MVPVFFRLFLPVFVHFLFDALFFFFTIEHVDLLISIFDQPIRSDTANLFMSLSKRPDRKADLFRPYYTLSLHFQEIVTGHYISRFVSYITFRWSPPRAKYVLH
jgi:hypothetical protein